MCDVLHTPTRVSVRSKIAAKSKEKLLDRDTQRRSFAYSRKSIQLLILLVNSKSSFGNKEKMDQIDSAKILNITTPEPEYVITVKDKYLMGPCH